MRIVLLNPTHTAIGSRVPVEHLPPLGLLAIGGPLIDAGHSVRLLDGDRLNLTVSQIVDRIVRDPPELLLLGHSGSTSAHPTVVEITRILHAKLPLLKIIYGGVFPTYHYREVLEQEPQFTAIVRGEGEETALALVTAIEQARVNAEPLFAALAGVRGIAYRDGTAVRATPAREVIGDLDSYRVGWELIDHKDYSYWGELRAVVVQFSRGCPHPCNYCGQRGFWTRWRHRDPQKFAAEIARLHRDHGVVVFNFADENPTSNRRAWRAFLEALIAENVKVKLVGSTRAGDIVRDKDILHLYKQAGCERFLMGMEHTDEATLALIRKGSTSAIDREAIQLLREHNILSMATYVVGFEEERDRDYLHAVKQLLSYDPDQVQILYVTPHRWTPFYRFAEDRKVIQLDRRRWDYKHQVLETKYVPPWRVLLWVKGMEVLLQTRPKALRRMLAHPDPEIRRAQWWYSSVGKRVWVFEIAKYLFEEKRVQHGPTMRELWGPAQDEEEESMIVPRRGKLGKLVRMLPQIVASTLGGAAADGSVVAVQRNAQQHTPDHPHDVAIGNK